MPSTMISNLALFSDADLLQRARRLHKTAKRDIEHFSARNITKESLRQFQQLIDEFDNSLVDVQLMAKYKKLGQEKEALVSILRRMLRSIANMADMAFDGKGHYRTFGFEGLSDMSDVELCALAKRVNQVAARLMPHLAPQGLSMEQLEALASFEADLETKIAACKEVAKKQEAATQCLQQQGQALFTEMMRWADIGKAFFENVDESRFYDYAVIGEPVQQPNAASSKLGMPVR